MPHANFKLRNALKNKKRNRRETIEEVKENQTKEGVERPGIKLTVNSGGPKGKADTKVWDKSYIRHFLIGVQHV